MDVPKARRELSDGLLNVLVGGRWREQWPFAILAPEQLIVTAGYGPKEAYALMASGTCGKVAICFDEELISADYMPKLACPIQSSAKNGLESLLIASNPTNQTGVYLLKSQFRDPGSC